MTELSKLKSEIEAELLTCLKMENENITYWAHRIAENVVRKKIEQAFDAGKDHGKELFLYRYPTTPNKDQWIKNNI